MKRAFRWCLLAISLTLGACSSAPPRQPAGVEGARSPRLEADSDLQRRWLEIYRQVCGRPYRPGGRDRQGFDCSGLVQYAYELYDGRSLPRTTGALYGAGRPVERARTGDLLFYGKSSRPSHVGIYLWDSWFLHAARDGVILSSTRERYYADRFLGVRRLK
jgi:hypothetical protein